MTARALAPLPPGSPPYRDGFHSPGGVTVAYEEHSKQHVIEGDGLCPLIYQHLFKTTKGREHTLSTVRLPDTVIFDHNFPRAWFAYDAENKTITKRSSKMLDAQTMYEHFSKRSGADVGPRTRRGRSSSAGIRGSSSSAPGMPTSIAPASAAAAAHEGDIVAQFFHTAVPVSDEWREVLTRKERASGAYVGQQLVRVEFLTAPMLHDFLFQQQRKPDGVLQRFVLPKSEGTSRRNAQLQVTWSPLLTTVYKRTNRHRLDDHAISLTARASTYDGPRWHSEETMVADETKARLTSLCEDIAEHFFSTEGKRLTRLGLYFKTDDHNNMWLLWCSGVRVAADSLNPSFLRVPLSLHLRTEVVNDGCTTVARIEGRRRRQKQLLALDYELYKVTKDLAFAQMVNISHKRQAKALDMHAMTDHSEGGEEGGVSQGEGHHPHSHLHNPHHALYPSFQCIWTAQDAANASLARPASGGNSGGRRPISRSASAASARDAHRVGSAGPDAAAAGGGGGGAVSVQDRVQEEMVALALDAWYAVYSTTLADDPRAMSTRVVDIAAPLQGCLTAEELDVLARDLLGLQRVRRGSKESALAASRGVEDPVALFAVAPYLVGPGRRLDRPLAQVEKEVRDFFTDLFAYRGQEVTQMCLSKYAMYFEEA